MAKDQFSELRKAYAEATGLNIRTAQRHSEKNHPDWQKFIGTTAAEGASRKSKEGEMTPVEAEALGAVSPFQPEEMPAFYDVPNEDLHPVQRLEKEAWQIHSQTFATWKEIVVHPDDALVALAHARELPKLRDNWDKARQKREAWEMEQRTVVPMAEFTAFKNEFLTPLAEMLRGIPHELPVVVNPNDPGFAREQLNDWLRGKVDPNIRRLLTGADDFEAA